MQTALEELAGAIDFPDEVPAPDAEISTTSGTSLELLEVTVYLPTATQAPAAGQLTPFRSAR